METFNGSSYRQTYFLFCYRLQSPFNMQGCPVSLKDIITGWTLSDMGVRLNLLAKSGVPAYFIWEHLIQWFIWFYLGLWVTESKMINDTCCKESSLACENSCIIFSVALEELLLSMMKWPWWYYQGYLNLCSHTANFSIKHMLQTVAMVWDTGKCRM